MHRMIATKQNKTEKKKKGKGKTWSWPYVAKGVDPM